MLLQFAANGSVLPFFAMLLRDRGLPYDRISMIFTASSATMLFFPFLWGMLADRLIPLNRLFIFMNWLGSAALVLMTFQRSYVGLLVAFTIYSACVIPTFVLTNALCFHHLPNPREQFGFVRAFGSCGWILPFLPISLWTAWRPGMGLDLTLWMGAGLSMVMGVFAFRLPHTVPGALKRAAGERRGHYGPALRKLLLNPNYLVVLTSMFLMSGSFTLVLYYAPPFLEKLGLSRPWIGPVQAIGVVFEIVLFQWQPYLIRRFRYTSVILVGCLALTLRHLLFAVSDNLWLLSGSYLLVAAVVVFHHMGISILANAIATVEVKSTAQTLLSFFGLGLGPMFANWMAGRLVQGEDLRPVFLFGAILAAVATCLVGFRSRQLNDAARG